MPATLQDVAQAANVSLTTVSRVLLNRHGVAPETVELVEEVIRKVGYERAATRRGRPAANRTPLPPSVASSIALLFTAKTSNSSQTPLLGQLIDGIETVARERGFHLLVTRLLDGGDLPLCLDPVQVDGLIVRSPSGGTVTRLPPVPTVWVFRPGFGPAPGDIVDTDNERFAQIGADYLLERGHRHVAVINPRPEHPAAHTRTDRFIRFAKARGVTPFVIEGGRLTIDEIISELLASTPRVTGIFLPLGLEFVEQVYLALQGRGVRCGEDMDLISSNEYLRSLDSRLPNIDIRTRDIGRFAAETLLWRIQYPHEPRRCILIEPRLVEPSLPNGSPNQDNVQER
jgi:LacI family transcriptional regulator